MTTFTKYLKRLMEPALRGGVFSYSASDKEFIKEGILPYSHISTLSPIFTCSKTPVNDSGAISK